MSFTRKLLCFACATLCSAPLVAQETSGTDDPPDTGVKDKAAEVAGEAEEKVEEVRQQVDESEQAKEISAGILQPIYQLAEYMSFAAFHWVAFAVMAAGVVSYALQLVLTKLALLFRGSLNISEILTDALGLVISLVGLVLTTQAAAENSTFTQSAFSVISASAVGLIVGLLFYRWGHLQESQALKGRKVEAKKG